MEDKKGKDILFINGLFEDTIPGNFELIKDLMDLGHKVTCYIYDEFSEKYKDCGAKLKPYKIDKSDFNQFPPAVLEKASLSLTFTRAYIAILSDALKSEEKYDYLLVDSYFDGVEMNKIFKIPTVISLYSSPIEIKTPFIELTKQKRMRFLNQINEKFNINIRDYLSIRHIADAKFKLMLTSRLFHNDLKMINDSFYFIGPYLEQKDKDKSFYFKKDENKKLINIYVFSLFNQNIDFYKMCVNVFGNSKEFQVIISVGEKVDIKKEFGDLPENISIYNNVPQLEILPKTDVFITDSRMEAIILGLFMNNLPLIVIKQENEYNNVKLIEKYEAGMALNIQKLTNEALLESVNNFLSKKSKYQIGVEKISKSFQEARNERKQILEKIFA